MIKLKKRKAFSWLLVIVFIVSLIRMPIFTSASSENESVFVKIRYSREDAIYDGWNIWAWEQGKEGKRVDFIGEDSEGKFAVIETSKDAEKLGFIIRKSVQGNDWAEKVFNDDKFVELSKGDTEVVINQNGSEPTLSERNIKLDFDKVTVKLNYFRFDGSYTDWDVWGWIGNKDGQGYPFVESDFGRVSTMAYNNIGTDDKIGFIIRKSDWSQKDWESDRFINKVYANNDGLINAYVVQGEGTVYYSEKDVVKDPKITSAKIDTLKDITFKTNFKLPSKDILNKVTLKKGNNNVEIESVTVNDNLMEGTIKVRENLDLNSKYQLSIEGFNSKELSLGKIYDSKEFADIYTYSGSLGANYYKDKTRFVLWAPTATEVKLALYGDNSKNYTNGAEETIVMNKGENGTWYVEKLGDLNGEYYNYLVTIDGNINEVTDPYAKAVGVNGNRGMVVDLASTNPEGWENDTKPALVDPTDSIIYEMHIRDFSIDENSGITLEYKGKYNGVWQSGTTIPGSDVKTGVDHLKELGVTTVHILPTFDHRSIDETKLDTNQYNWGYDPQNYNVPEGSYSSDPYAGEIRIKEFKEMVQELHKSGIRVVMDVVYNHTGATLDSNLNLAVPDYYYRQNSQGGFSNGSGCGNETASERSMVRKLIVESVVYWASEYHIDGFRFDLMGLHDIETMKQIRTELDKIDPTILMYGEGWTGGDSPLSSEEAAIKANTTKYGNMQIAAFSDDIRDGIKGHVFTATAPAFVNGGEGFEETIKFGIVASTENEQIDYSKVANGTKAWANQPYQTINYASAHDNLTLWDKLQTTNPNASEEELLLMNKMSAAIVYTSQGIPFMQAGEEFARTKVNPDGSLNENSYNAPDSVNKIDWERKVEYSNLNNYYKGLISLRKSHKSFRMNSAEDIQDNLKFIDVEDKNLVAYTLDGTNIGDSWDKIAVLFNANKEAKEVTLPGEDWVVVVDQNNAGIEKLATIEGSKVKIPAQTSYVLVDKSSFDEGSIEDGNNPEKPSEDTNKPTIDNSESGNPSKTGDETTVLPIVIILLVSGLAIGVFARKKQSLTK